MRIRFDSKPVINSGFVEVYDAATDKLVDSVEVQGTDDNIGYTGQSNARKMHIVPTNIIGEDERTVSIKLHTKLVFEPVV